MTGRLVLGLIGAGAALASAACEPPPPTNQPPSVETSLYPEEPLDPFVVMIGAERWGVLLDKAREGVREAPTTIAGDESDALRTDHATKSGAAELLILRNNICAKGLMSGDDCDVGAWPAWTSEPPTADTPLAVLNERSDWLGATMGRFVELGCQQGRVAFNDDMFCSVE